MQNKAKRINLQLIWISFIQILLLAFRGLSKKKEANFLSKCFLSDLFKSRLGLYKL